jgi:hypothetical protein
VRVAQDKVEGLITVSLRDEPEDQGQAAPETTAEADQAMPPA